MDSGDQSQDADNAAVEQVEKAATKPPSRAKKKQVRERITDLLAGCSYTKEADLTSLLTDYKPKAAHGFLIHRGWLWIAYHAQDQQTRTYFLGKARKLAKDFNKNKKLIAEIEEGLIETLVKISTLPRLTLLPDSENITKGSYLQFHIQQLLQRASRGEKDQINFDAIVDILSTPYHQPLVYETVSIFIVYGLYNELKQILGRVLSTGKMKKDIPKYNHHYINVLIYFIRLNINLEKESIDQYLIQLEEFYSENARLIADDYRLDAILVLIHNLLGNCLETREVKSGESLMVNACNFMNPFNREYFPKMALLLLEDAIKKTYICADIFLEYIRCKLLLDINYSIEESELLKDPYINDYFFLTHPHIGFSWVFLSYESVIYINDFKLLVKLAEKIKDYIIKYENAYNKRELFKYDRNDFQTALGNPQNFLDLRQMLFSDNACCSSTASPVIKSLTYRNSAVPSMFDFLDESKTQTDTPAQFLY